MASIDKIYCNSYKDYKEFKDWCDNQIVTFFDRYSVCAGDYVYDYEESDFTGEYIPIINSPVWLDVYFIKHCKIDFVIDRLNAVYDNVDKLKAIELSVLPNGYKRKRKIYIQKNDRTTFSLNSPYNEEVTNWRLQSNDRFWFNETTNKWISREQYYPFDTDTVHLKSVTAVIKHLRKQHLPSRITFSLQGKYIGQHYTIHVI